MYFLKAILITNFQNQKGIRKQVSGVVDRVSNKSILGKGCCF
jgi:hypothetical protein